MRFQKAEKEMRKKALKMCAHREIKDGATHLPRSSRKKAIELRLGIKDGRMA